MVKFNAPGARVLVVDDIKTNLEVVKGVLSLYGVRVDTCMAGAEAISLANSNDYDLIFMDYMMPEMDGLEAAKRIRLSGGACEGVPIIAHTASIVTGTQEALLRSEFDDLLPKPIDMGKMDELLKKWIPEKKQRPAREKVEYYKEIGMDIVIEGVDVKSGMARIGGDVIAYLRTLAVFGGDGREKIKEIRQSIDDDDLRRFTIGVHALKSAAGNIGACALSELAKEFETAGRNEDREFINKNSPRLLADFEALLRGIDETLLAAKEKRSQIVVDKEAIKSTLADLNTAIDALDPDGINAAAGELRRLGIIAEIGDEIEIILRKTLVGDFDEAISLIEKLLRQKA